MSLYKRRKRSDEIDSSRRRRKAQTRFLLEGAEDIMHIICVDQSDLSNPNLGSRVSPNFGSRVRDQGGGVGRPNTISDPVDQTKSKAYAGFEGQILHSKLRFSDGTDFQSSWDDA